VVSARTSPHPLFVFDQFRDVHPQCGERRRHRAAPATSRPHREPHPADLAQRIEGARRPSTWTCVASATRCC
jgi:hypothetical protein